VPWCCINSNPDETGDIVLQIGKGNGDPHLCLKSDASIVTRGGAMVGKVNIANSHETARQVLWALPN
jgi:hypothetical protein